MTTSLYRLYGRRKGRPLRVRKNQLMMDLLPAVKIDLVDEKPIDPSKFFNPAPSKIWLEIGFGGGEHLAAQAKRHPTIGFIGCEPFVNGVASLLDHMEREHLSNVRIFPDDARLLLDVLPTATIDRCFILFADPWPKGRHASRRFIGSETLSRLGQIIKKDGDVRLATDDPSLTDWIRGAFHKDEHFKRGEDSTQCPTDWVSTRYEQKAIKAGRHPVYMRYIRL
jgi:tRNA (guanine-N7-)-methyltransferase